MALPSLLRRVQGILCVSSLKPMGEAQLIFGREPRRSSAAPSSMSFLELQPDSQLAMSPLVVRLAVGRELSETPASGAPFGEGSAEVRMIESVEELATQFE